MVLLAHPFVGAAAEPRASSVLHIDYYSNGEQNSNVPVTIDWSDAKTCLVRIPPVNKSLHAESADCRAVLESFQKTKSQFKAKNDLGANVQFRKLHESSRNHYDDVQVNGMNFAIWRTGAERCDANEKNCVPASDQPVDIFGFKLLHLLAGAK